MNAVNKDLKLKDLKPSKNVSRADYTRDLADLMQSMKVNGLVHPVVVRKNGTGYSIVAGHRRYASAKKLDWPTVPCRIIHINDNEQVVLNITENINRQDVTLTETYIAFDQLRKAGLSQPEIASQVGIPLNRVKETFKLEASGRLDQFKDRIVFTNESKVAGKISYNKALSVLGESRRKGLSKAKTNTLLSLAEDGVSKDKINVAAAALKDGKTAAQVKGVVEKLTEVRFSILVDNKKRTNWEKTTGKNFIVESRKVLKRQPFGKMIIG